MNAAIRHGDLDDVSVCVAIKNAWIDGTDWMPRIHEASSVERHYRNVVFPDRKVFVVGTPVFGFMTLDACEGEVTDLFVVEKARSNGLGKALLDRAKDKLSAVSLWTFVANEGARRFYAREGFDEVLQTDGDNEEGLPDVLLWWSKEPVRRAGPGDAASCARIVSAWIDQTDWLPRLHSLDALTAMIVEAMPSRDIYLIGEPCDGYLSLNPETGHIGALYTSRPGAGLGKTLLDRAKLGRDYLQLNTHDPNQAAQRFYKREGFEVVERLPDGIDGLPELRMEWRR